MARAPRAARTLLAADSEARLIAVLPGLAPARRPARAPAALAPRPPLSLCQPPTDRWAPAFVVRYTRLVLAPPRPTGPERPPAGGAFTPLTAIACTEARVEAAAGLALTFEQTWNLQDVLVGDLASTMGLAPAETLTLEVFSSQRRLLEQTTVDQTQEITSVENTTLDKEVMNAAHSASKTEKWGVNGSGSFSLGFVKIGAGADLATTTTATAQSSVQQIHEATRKAAHSLTTLHKVEVRGVSESITQTRGTRTIVNPYHDRTLALNVFQLVKRYAVETRQVAATPVLAVEVQSLTFDREFVITQAGFLDQAILDRSLLERIAALPSGIPLTEDTLAEKTAAAATAAAERALRFLFRVPNVFNLPPSLAAPGVNVNDPDTSFDAQRAVTAFGKSGFGDALANSGIVLFTTAGLYYRVYRDAIRRRALGAEAVTLATSLAEALDAGFTTLTGAMDDRLINLMDNESLTEVFRRIPGFLALVKGTVQPLAQAAQDAAVARDARAQALAALDLVVEHLRCHTAYYTRRYLAYLAETTANQALVDLVERVLAEGGARFGTLAASLDVQRAFLDGQTVIAPGFVPLPDDWLAALARSEGTAAPPPPPVQVQEVDLPCDGIHLEVAPGVCVLPDLPAPAAAVTAG